MDRTSKSGKLGKTRSDSDWTDSLYNYYEGFAGYLP